MKNISRNNAVTEILESIENTNIPADSILSSWAKKNRYAGSKDRKYIVETIYNIIRNKAKILWQINNFFCKNSQFEKEKVFFENSNENHKLMAVFYFGYSKQDKQDVFLENNFFFENSIFYEALYEYANNLKSLINEKMDECTKNEISSNVFNDLFSKNSNLKKTMKIIKSLNVEALSDVRVNSLKTNITEIEKTFKNNDIEFEKTPYSNMGLRIKKRYPLSSLKEFKKGFFEMQDESSQIASLLCNPKKGEKIVDFCAGAGGKSLAFSQLMENTGRIIACDVNDKRLSRAKKRFKRAGVSNVENRLLKSENDKWVKRRKERFDGGFDKVFLDVPCSGSGTWRRNPEQKWRISKEKVENILKIQANILNSACKLVKKNGILIYATCSIILDENSNQIDHFLNKNSNFDLLDIKDIWNNIFNTECPTNKKTLTLNPLDNNTDGFFIAILKRKN